MKRTTVYLTDQEREGLRRLSITTGKSQAALIRGALENLLSRPVSRKFHSMGKGRSEGTGGPGISRKEADSLYRRKMGR